MLDNSTIHSHLLQEMGEDVSDKTALLDLIAQGCKPFYTEIFGARFVNVLDSRETNDKHHSESIQWHWLARLLLIQCEKELEIIDAQYQAKQITEEQFVKLKNETQEKYYPAYWAYFAIWSRGNMKTTIARRMVIADAMLSYAFGVGGYALIVGGTKNKAKGSATSIDTLLQSDKVKQYAEPLTRVSTTDKGQSKGWTAAFINTAGNYIFHFIGLDEGVAGANVDDIRPTFIIPDDIDDREDSPVIAQNRFEVLTRAVIPAKQWNTLFFFAQNLISRFSVLYQIWTQQVRVLTNRYFTEPIPAVRNPVYEERTVNGIVKDIIVSGEVTWRGWDLREIQNQIDSMTLPIFKLECQHEVQQSREGLMHKTYNDNVHPISLSQFASVYGSTDAWKSWYKCPASDWARTKSKYHANVAAYMCVSSQNTYYPGLTFMIPYSFPAGTQPEDLANRLLSALTPYATGKTTWKELIDDAWKRSTTHQTFETEGDRLAYISKYYQNTIPNYSRPVLEKHNVKSGVNSHSEDICRKMLNMGFGFSFAPSNPSKLEALEEIDQAMKVDYSLPHLFDPTKKGYTRWYVLCDDDTSQTPTIVNGIAVYPPVPFPETITPDDLHDADLFRYQMLNRRFLPPKLTETGERIDEPEKLNDDFGQMLQMIYKNKILDNIEFTSRELLEKRIADKVSFNPQTTEALAPQEDISHQMARMFAIKEMRQEGYDIDGFGEDIEYDPDDLSGGW